MRVNHIQSFREGRPLHNCRRSREACPREDGEREPRGGAAGASRKVSEGGNHEGLAARQSSGEAQSNLDSTDYAEAPRVPIPPRRSH